MFLVISINLKISVMMGQMRICSASTNAVTSCPQIPFAMSNQQQKIAWVRIAEKMVMGLSDFSRAELVANAWGSGSPPASLACHGGHQWNAFELHGHRIRLLVCQSKQTNKRNPKQNPKPIQPKKSHTQKKQNNKNQNPKTQNNSWKNEQFLIWGIIYSPKSLHGGHSKTSEVPFWG